MNFMDPMVALNTSATLKFLLVFFNSYLKEHFTFDVVLCYRVPAGLSL